MGTLAAELSRNGGTTFVAHVLHLDTVKDFVSKLLNKLRELVKSAFKKVVDLLFGKKEVKDKACKLCGMTKEKQRFTGVQNAGI
jgi:hypothetical protein